MLPELLTSIPGPASLALAGELRRYESPNVTYTAPDFPIFWERAEGTNVWDADGNRFLDLTAAFGVCGLGHSNPAVVEAARDQFGRLSHAMGDVHPAVGKAALCRKLSEITFERWGAGIGQTILGNSGFEAVEAALKTSLLYSGKPGVIAFTGAYHGVGYGALETSGLPYFREPFRRQLRDFATLIPYPHCYHCPFGAREGFRLEGNGFPNCSSSCLRQLREEIETVMAQREIGAILVEPIQGRGGLVVPPLDFLRLLREICDAAKILLIVDEIFTGFNRTGKLFACEHSRVVPDLICLGKGLTSGFPLSACVGRQTVMSAWPESAGEALHTSTFLGHPVGCRMALASIGQHVDPAMARAVTATGKRLRQRLEAVCSPRIGHRRGLGMLQGVELIDAAGAPDGETAIRLVKKALQDGLLLLADSPAANVLSFTPPFELSDEEIGFVGDWLQENLTSLPGSIS